MLDERASLLGRQEIDLEVCEAILAEELERGLRPSDGQDLSVELKKIRARVDRNVVDCATEAEGLSQQVVRVASVLIDLGLLPIEEIL
jgi:hypothetical protein